MAFWQNGVGRSLCRRARGRAVDTTSKAKPDLLIVDDDPLITDTLNFVLSKDFDVYVADSRNQVKSLLRQLDTPRASPSWTWGCPRRPTVPTKASASSANCSPIRPA